MKKEFTQRYTEETQRDTEKKKRKLGIGELGNWVIVASLSLRLLCDLCDQEQETLRDAEGLSVELCASSVCLCDQEQEILRGIAALSVWLCVSSVKLCDQKRRP